MIGENNRKRISIPSSSLTYKGIFLPANLTDFYLGFSPTDSGFLYLEFSSATTYHFVYEF